MVRRICFFLNDPATTEIYPLSLHDALPISGHRLVPLRACRREKHGREKPNQARRREPPQGLAFRAYRPSPLDRKSTRLNSSHANISYAVFCLKKKKNNKIHFNTT